MSGLQFLKFRGGRRIHGGNSREQQHLWTLALLACAVLLPLSQAHLYGHSRIRANALPRLLTTAPPFNTATQKALLDFKAAVTTSDSSWGPTWTAGAACNTWLYLTCDASGNLLTMSMPGKLLTGAIPQSFYSITTLTKLDLSRNRLYGTVNRYLGTINPNLQYLDLSFNFFSGQYPDVWSFAPYYDDSNETPPIPNPNYPLYVGNYPANALVINISNTYFTGYQTIWSASYAAAGPPYACIAPYNLSVLGDVSKTCVTVNQNIPRDFSKPGWCGTADNNPPLPVLRSSDDCQTWCGTVQGFSPGDGEALYSTLQPQQACSAFPGAVCKPTFTTATSSVVKSVTCDGSAPAPTLSLSTSSSGVVSTADAATLKALSTALGNPTALSNFTLSSPTCTQLSPRALCDSTRKIIALDLSGLSLGKPIPSAIANFASLQSLKLNNSQFTGPWPFDLTQVLLQLVYLDVSNNQLTGPIPSMFSSTPVRLNFANNFFTGDPIVYAYDSTLATTQNTYGVAFPFPANQGIGGPVQNGYNIYCPSSTTLPFAAGNCFTPSYSSPCVQEPQRTSGCPATLTPPPQGNCNSFPIRISSLLWFRDQYLAYGSPATAFKNWDRSKKCSDWQGLTCNDGCRITAVNMSGLNLTGPFPSPQLLQGIFYSPKGGGPNSQTDAPITFLDFSKNQLYGVIDPKLAIALNIVYLDFSNNLLTGSLPPGPYQSNFKYFNFANNYLVGSPGIMGKDFVTKVCPGSTFPGSLQGNCFDNSNPACPVSPRSDCTTFCSGASSSKWCCGKRNQVCKLVTTTKKTTKVVKRKKVTVLTTSTGLNCQVPVQSN